MVLHGPLLGGAGPHIQKFRPRPYLGKPNRGLGPELKYFKKIKIDFIEFQNEGFIALYYALLKRSPSKEEPF